VTTDTHELAWAAGFFDGEGSSSLNVQRDGRKTTALSIGQTNREPLDKFDRATSNIGAVGGPYQPKNPKHTPWYRWSTGGLENCQLVMDMLWPWLCSIKREQWDVAKQGLLEYKEELLQTQMEKRRARTYVQRALTKTQLDQVLKVIEPWRYEKEDIDESL
jgi:hypothetical protein